MSQRPTPAPQPAYSLDDLRRLYGHAWEIIQHTSLPVWSAEHKSGDGRSVRYIVAYSAAELAAKLETAGVVEP